MRKTAPTAARRRGVVGAAVLRQGFAKHVRRRRGVGEGRGCALACVFSPPLTPLFIGEGARGAGPSRWDLEGGSGQGGGTCPPSKGGAPSRVPPNPRCMGPRGFGAQPT